MQEQDYEQERIKAEKKEIVHTGIATGLVVGGISSFATMDLPNKIIEESIDTTSIAYSILPTVLMLALTNCNIASFAKYYTPVSKRTVIGTTTAAFFAANLMGVAALNYQAATDEHTQEQPATVIQHQDFE